MGWFGGGQKSETVDWQSRFRGLAEEASLPALEAFYRQGCVAGNTPLSESPLVALDLETTGLDPRRHAIVSVGVVPFDLDRIRSDRSFYRVVRPRRDLEERSITIHGLTHEEVDAAPDFEQLAERLLEMLAGRVAVVHYHAIERRFLYEVFMRRFGEGVLFPLIDTLEIEKGVGQQSGFNPLSRFSRRPRSLRLADARRRYGLPEYAPHHALTDALATAELFQAQLAHHGDPGDPVSRWWR